MVKLLLGYYLNGIFVGLEGIFGCFMELILKVYGILEYVMVVRVLFLIINDVVEVVINIL